MGGDTTYDFLARWDKIKQYVSREIWIHIGLNDLRLGVNVSCTFKNMKAIQKQIAKDGINPIFLSVIHSDVPYKSIQLNKLMKNEFVNYINWSCLLNHEMYEKNHVHPNDKGKRLLVEGIKSCA